MKTLIIDNYDSFTYNIYQLVAQINSKPPIVIKNNQLSWSEIQQGNFDNIIISPGPGNPQRKDDFGVCAEVLRKAEIPILGICLGHQGLGYYYGAKVVKAPEPFHGRISKIYHSQDALFAFIPSPFEVVRYHSLILAQPLAPQLQVIASTQDDLIMGIKHRSKPFWGVQFHPESIASEYGKQLLTNFSNLTQQYRRSPFSSSSVRMSSDTNNCVEKKQSNFIPRQVNSPRQLTIFSHKIDSFVDSAQVFTQLYGESSHSFWLDSSMVAQGLSRFSYMGDSQGKHSFLISYQVKNQQITTVKNGQTSLTTGDIFDFLQAKLEEYIIEEAEDLPFNFNGGFVGYFGYELKSLCGVKNRHEAHEPDAQFIFVAKMIIFDHQAEEIYLLHLAKKEEKYLVEKWFNQTEKKIKKLENINHKKTATWQDSKGETFCLSREKDIYLSDINYCLQQIKAGESYEICLTNNLYLPPIQEPLAFYNHLRKNHPAPYSAFFSLGEMAIACSSPERFLKLEKNAYLESKPIKGTVKRGKNKEEDEQLKNKLKCSEKEQAENLMIVDLLRNDLGKICEIGSVTVPKLMAIESYSTVHQMVSTVRGKIKAEVKISNCIKACFPGGSMTGAPKKRTMEIIDQLETEARGIYSGAIGFLALNGTMDLNIVIRTAIITPEQTTIGIGGAITILSHPDGEFAETILKAKAFLDN